MKKIFWGLCLLLTPCFNIIDILPDVLGCLLLRSGLKEVSLINDSLSNARQDLKKLMWLEGAKLASFALLWIFRDDTTTLLLTFVFSTLELLFYFPFVTNLFNGLESLGTKHGISPIIEHSDTAKLLLKLFIVIRCCTATLPEMTCLVDPVLNGDFSANYLAVSAQLKATKYLATIVQYIAVGAFGIAIMLYLKKITRAIRALPEAINSLKTELVEKIGPEQKKLLAFDKSLWLLYLAAVLSIRFYLSYYNPICDFLMFIPLYLAAKPVFDKERLSAWRTKCVVLGVIGAICFVLRSYGAGFFYPSFTAQWQRFIPVYPAGILSAISLAMGMFMMIKLLGNFREQIISKPLKTTSLRVLAVIISILGFFDYSFPGLYHFVTIFTGNAVRLQYTLDAINASLSAIRIILCAVFVFKFTSICLKLREEVKLN